MNTQTPFIVVSADRANYPEDINAERRELFERQIAARDLSATKAIGSYKGERETSYVIPIHNSRDEAVVLQLARRYSQESVLLVDANRLATLLYLNTQMGGEDIKSTHTIGFWRALESGAVLPESYTAVERDGHTTYYTTSPHP